MTKRAQQRSPQIYKNIQLAWSMGWAIPVCLFDQQIAVSADRLTELPDGEV
jgi:hypothetical protein